VKYWSHIVAEGYCFGKEGSDCGRNVPSCFCLGDGINGYCPHFAWSDSTEREAAHFVPLLLILKDRMLELSSIAWSNVHWWLWDHLWFNRKKVMDSLNNISVATASNSPVVAEWEDNQTKNEDAFKVWFSNISH